ncbi:MAG: sensor histidine kinase [bacterium]|nr:sensor histidine kinase [bacterium]
MEQLLSQNSFLRDVIDEAPYGVVVFDASGVILLENELARQFISHDNQSLVKRNIKEMFQVFEMEELLTQIIEGSKESFDVMELVFDEKVLTVRCRKRQDWSILTVQDITKWKHIEMTAVQSIIETQEKERQRIATEIHDGIGPQISTTIHQLETIAENIKESDPETATRLESIVEQSNEVSSELRSISHSLMPRVLLDFGLTAALQTLVNRVNNSNRCKIEFINSFSGEALDQSIELNLYRICQELINNALKHAKATYIFVQLVKTEEHLTLMVEDDGKGFDLNNLKLSEGIGLSNIEMRTKVMNGELNIDSAPGRGSVVTVEISLHEH